MEAQVVERIRIMRKAAQWVIGRQYNPSQWQVDELVNHAWLNSALRLEDDCPEKKLFAISRMSMSQYINGKRGTRYTTIRSMDRKSVSIYDFDDTNETYYLAKLPQYTYDDVDACTTSIKQLSRQDRDIIIARLQGRTLREIGSMYGRSEAWACAKVQGVIRIMNGLISLAMS